MMSDNAPSNSAGVSDTLKSLPHYLLPHHLLSALMRIATRATWQPWKNWQIDWVIRRYGVDMSQARDPDPRHYTSFNSFFTRALAADARPLPAEANAICCPADGRISQIGAIRDGRIFQAKGRDFTALELLGGSMARAAPFEQGQFATVYLSPRDYHRVHMPLAGTLREMIHVPGRLFSVAPYTTRAIPRLFARNERVVSIFDTAAGPMAVVLVGALFVASIETVWAGMVTPPRRRGIRVWDYRNEARTLQRGAELGRFNMGSTAIVLFGRGRIHWDTAMQPDAPVQMGQRLGLVLP
ncbi:MAG: archaetidylserine decarboxylase [Gammaproteobacteria bacterium]